MVANNLGVRALRTSLALSSALFVLAGCGTKPEEPDLGTSVQAVNTAADAGSDVAAIQAYRDSFYTDSDIQHSFIHGGDEIDCIPFEAQASVKYFASQGIDVSLPNPPPAPTPPSTVPAANVLPGDAFVGQDDGFGNAEQCSTGTVPVSRPTVAEIEAAGGVAGYQAMLQRSRPEPQQSGFQHDCYEMNQWTWYNNYDHAAGVAVNNTTYYGMLSYASVHDPNVAHINSEHSLSQIWVQTGTCEFWQGTEGCSYPGHAGTGGDAVQSVESGWIVGAPYTTDTVPHLLVFMTFSGYDIRMGAISGCFAEKGGGCCPMGSSCWVQYGSYMTPGQKLTHYATAPGVPPEMAIQYWNGTASGYADWFLYINGQLIGYYPTSSFWGQMQSSASYLQAGGEIIDSWPGGPWPSGSHTTTEMGSGWSADFGWEYAAYQRDVMYIDSGNSYHDVRLGYVSTPSDDLDYGLAGVCGYDAGSDFSLDFSAAPGSAGWDSYFYFGGGP